MASFDPYYNWLGISPKHQPPNHYRLLGIELFEENLDVIDRAANRQMSYLHDLGAGEHQNLAQQLLNELSAARVCLLNPESRVQYDAELRAKQAAKSEKPIARPANPPPTGDQTETPQRSLPTLKPIPTAPIDPLAEAIAAVSKASEVVNAEVVSDGEESPAGSNDASNSQAKPAENQPQVETTTAQSKWSNPVYIATWALGSLIVFGIVTVVVLSVVFYSMYRKANPSNVASQNGKDSPSQASKTSANVGGPSPGQTAQDYEKEQYHKIVDHIRRSGRSEWMRADIGLRQFPVDSRYRKLIATELLNRAKRSGNENDDIYTPLLRFGDKNDVMTVVDIMLKGDAQMTSAEQFVLAYPSPEITEKMIVLLGDSRRANFAMNVLRKISPRPTTSLKTAYTVPTAALVAFKSSRRVEVVDVPETTTVGGEASRMRSNA